jgi:hypothetical protein
LLDIDLLQFWPNPFFAGLKASLCNDFHMRSPLGKIGHNLHLSGPKLRP